MSSGVNGTDDTYSNHRSSNDEGVPLPVGAISKKGLLQQSKLRRRIHQLREEKVSREEDVEKQRLLHVNSMFALKLSISKCVYIHVYNVHINVYSHMHNHV